MGPVCVPHRGGGRCLTVMLIGASLSCSAQSLANPGFVGNEGGT